MYRHQGVAHHAVEQQRLRCLVQLDVDHHVLVDRQTAIAFVVRPSVSLLCPMPQWAAAARRHNVHALDV
jgi:hypothetical protein